MTDLFPGLTVERQLPPDVLAGIYSGEFRVHGGVIRCAPGTPCAGRIVRHLLPVSGISPETLGTVLQHVARGTDQILAMAAGTMALAGLNLVVSAVGFGTLSRKLDAVESQLSEIQSDVKEIKALLERAERARLRAALRDLLRMESASDPDHRRAILHDARRDLGEIHERYLELLGGANSPDTAMAYEEYFSVTALARSRCTAELGMISVARQELGEAAEFWREQAHRVARDMLIVDTPERFLSPDYADVPFVEIAGWLDFAYADSKGYEWVDELRRREKQKSAEARGWGLSSLGGRIFGSQPSAPTVVPALQKLSNRDAVYGGYVAQYEILAEANIGPAEFERRLQDRGREDGMTGFLILRPETALAA